MMPLKTVVFTEKKTISSSHNTTYVTLDFKQSVVQQILDYAYQQGWLSILVEGGRYTLQQFIDQKRWDEARVFTGDSFPKEQGGVTAPVVKGSALCQQFIGKDQLTWLTTR